MLINQRFGTFGSLAVIFTDVPLPAAPAPHPFRCGTCTQCVDQCPTGALDADGLDARKCISYWTIEHRGIIPVEMRSALGDWVFGCDICQDACPWNDRAPRADPALWRPSAERAWPDLMSWLRMASADLEEALIGSPMRRARGQGLRRNALIVLANTNHQPALIEMERLATSDPDPVIRATAVWAAKTLGSPLVSAIAARDPDSRVRAEA
jgi:epoxyqueuosine reductase QueG